MKREINHLGILLISLCVFLFLPQVTHAVVLPDSFNLFRDTVYMQNRNVLDTLRLYSVAKQDIEESIFNEDLYLALSRCEYLMGLTFRSDGRNGEAAAYFEQGIAWAEKSLELCPTSEGYQILGTNIALLCEVRHSYGLKNFGKIEENAKKALDLDPHNLTANYIIAAQYIAAPWPFGNVKKGLSLLEEITKQNYLNMGKEDLFNLYLMLEAAYLKQKKNEEAKIWRERGAALYPTNNFISLLVK